MKTKYWYVARCVFKSRHYEDGLPRILFEERFVLLRATSAANAIAKAEAEALEYTKPRGRKFKVTYLGAVDVFFILDEDIEDKTEVYSLMRYSTLSNSKYLARYFDTQAIGPFMLTTKKDLKRTPRRISPTRRASKGTKKMKGDKP